MLRSPLNIDSITIALLRKGCHSSTEALAVSSPITPVYSASNNRINIIAIEIKAIKVPVLQIKAIK